MAGCIRFAALALIMLAHLGTAYSTVSWKRKRYELSLIGYAFLWEVCLCLRLCHGIIPDCSRHVACEISDSLHSAQISRLLPPGHSVQHGVMGAQVI